MAELLAQALGASWWTSEEGPLGAGLGCSVSLDHGGKMALGMDGDSWAWQRLFHGYLPACTPSFLDAGLSPVQAHP